MIIHSVHITTHVQSLRCTADCDNQPMWIGPMVTHDFTLAKLPILTWRYLYLLKMRICNLFEPLLWTKMLTPCLTRSSRALYKYYNFKVAEYWYSTATLSYRSLWYLKCTLSCRRAALQHIPCLNSAFDGNRASLQYQHLLCAVLISYTI